MLVKTHLIITNQYDKYNIKYVGKLIDADPELNQKGIPTFILISNKGRMEIETLDINYVETIAKNFAYPRGRGAVTSDKTRIYIKEKDNKEKLLTIVEKIHIRKYAPMFDEV
jgi:hypothetical protein